MMAQRQESERSIPKTMMVTWGFPPVLLGSSQIAAGLARQFSVDEMVVAAEHWPGLDRNKWDDEGGIKPAVYFIHKQWPWKFKRTIRLVLFPLVLWRVTRVFRASGAKQVLSMFPCEYYLFLSWIISRWYQVPLYTYFHNTYQENRTGIKRLFAEWLQPRVFHDSKIVFVMSEGMREVLAPKYPKVEFVPMVHSFEDRPIRLTQSPVPKWPLDVAFMGSVNHSNCDALSRISGLLKRYPETSLTTYSGNSSSDFEKLGIIGKRVKHTRVAFDEVVAALRQHDILFFPHGFTGGLSEIEYKTIFPTRTTPYLLSGLPMVVHSPKDSFLTRWIRERDCAEVVDTPDENALISAFERLAGNAVRCQVLSRNAQDAAEEFFAPRVAALLRRRLSGLT